MDIQKDTKPFFAMWVAVHESYGRTLSPMAVKLAFRALSSWPINDIARAVEAHLSDPDAGRFVPKPADIVRHLLDDGTQDLAERAWSRVTRGIAQVGPWQSIRCDDPLILSVIRDMGGWIKLCAMESEQDLCFAGKEFTRRYAAYVGRGRAGEPVDKLAGIAERDLIASGYPENVPDPIPLPGQADPPLH